MTTPLAKNDQNLIWIDLEMTGLYPDTDRIIEIAVIVTDSQLNVRADGPTIAVHQSDATLDAMDAWNKGTHGRSGLIDRVRRDRGCRYGVDRDWLCKLGRWLATTDAHSAQ